MRAPSKMWLVHGLLLAGFVTLGLKAVDEPRNNFRFAVIGDRTGGAQPQIYGRVWREVDLLHPDFVLNVGDTIQGGKDATAAEEWREMRPIWERYKHYPVYFTPGNHDIWSDASRVLYEQESGRPARYGFDYEDAHFTVLDTSQARTLSEDELRFLEADLEANKEKSPKAIVFHHPFWIDLIDNGPGDFELHQIAKKYGVSHILSGHGHRFVRRVHDGIAYMEVGSSGGSMTGGLIRGEGFADGIFYHWIWAQVKGGKMSFTVKEIGGQMGRGRMFKAEDWTENGPSFNVDDPALSEGPTT